MDEETSDLLEEAQRRLDKAKREGGTLSATDVDETLRAVRAARRDLKDVDAEKSERGFRTLQLFMQSLTPISVAVLAWLLTAQQKQGDQEIARWAIVPALMDDLFSTQAKQRDMAAQVTRFVLREEGEKLLAGLARAPSTPPEVRKSIVDAELVSTIDSLFSAQNQKERQGFFDVLKHRRQDKETVIDGLLLKAAQVQGQEKDPVVANGLFNIAQLLAAMPEEALKSRAAELKAALPALESNGPATKGELKGVWPIVNAVPTDDGVE